MITLEYIQDKPLSKEYICLLRQYYKDEYAERIARIDWYKNNFEYRILIARLDGVLVGQSCSYKVNAMLNGSLIDVWWGVDNFVLPSVRGRGIGKKLQRKLHEDLPNFSSAWYSSANRHIKMQCGAREIADLRFCYYPVSCFFSPFLFLISKKLFGCGSCPAIRLPFVYGLINGITTNVLDVFSFRETNISDIDDAFIYNIESFLKEKDFYIKRNKRFFELKYGAEHGLKYHAYTVYRKSSMEAFFAFAEVNNIFGVKASIKNVKILDSIIKPESLLTQKDIYSFIVKYYKNKRIVIDGILSLQDAHYLPKYAYPHPSSPLLSLIDTDKLNDIYVSYIDQDMEF